MHCTGLQQERLKAGYRMQAARYRVKAVSVDASINEGEHGIPGEATRHISLFMLLGHMIHAVDPSLNNRVVQYGMARACSIEVHVTAY